MAELEQHIKLQQQQQKRHHHQQQQRMIRLHRGNILLRFQLDHPEVYSYVPKDNKNSKDNSSRETLLNTTNIDLNYSIELKQKQQHLQQQRQQIQASRKSNNNNDDVIVDDECLASCFPNCQKPTYQAGQCITGCVVIRPVYRMKISGVYVKIWGHVGTKWRDDDDDGGGRIISASNWFYQQNVSIVRNRITTMIITTHVWLKLRNIGYDSIEYRFTIISSMSIDSPFTERPFNVSTRTGKREINSQLRSELLNYLKREKVCPCLVTRPDGCTLIPWRAGRCLAWDVTVPGTLAERYVNLTKKECRLAAARAADEKMKKYGSALSSMEFLPICIEVLGPMDPNTLKFLKAICKMISVRSGDSRELFFATNHISCLLQRFLRVCVLENIQLNADMCN
ncbi:hypothetical protein HELRODRAFT_176296 [Helobdella robusta]|uniref:Arrestin-like N-terminal domain-containing protein n=1 Tax=Helobdella robusta TaxID=6412 RepID=T1FAD5_HELRO|nr:hypothetical protein HELRODRAFT_176296 [Helobdella robusta]ESN99993.1 hypothetical protein HELRODRAFT_176296 [Helobdella robusta]